jgi:hypothetical protein
MRDSRDHQTIHISIEDIFPVAESYFLSTARFDRNSEKHMRMWSRALEIYEELRKKAELKAVFRYLVPEKMEGKDSYFQGVPITCNAFERLSPENVKGAYFYLLTAGDVHTDSEQVVDQLYSDIWGTSLVDAMRKKVGEHILSVESAKEEAGVLSEPFGPGYYGMALEQTAELFRIIDASLVNVSLSPGGMMLPQKSVTGLYLSVKDGNQLPPLSCESCIGGAAGCAFCNRSGMQKSF